MFFDGLHGPRQDDKLTSTLDALDALSMMEWQSYESTQAPQAHLMTRGVTGNLTYQDPTARCFSGCPPPRSGPLKMTKLTLPLLHFERTSSIFQSCLAN
jgi:hypothetical protein